MSCCDDHPQTTSACDIPPARRQPAEVPGVSGSGELSGVPWRADEAGDGHCPVGVCPMRPLCEVSCAQARQEGLSPAEIDEAAWPAIAFGGCPTMMFYNENKPH